MPFISCHQQLVIGNEQAIFEGYKVIENKGLEWSIDGNKKTKAKELASKCIVQSHKSWSIIYDLNAYWQIISLRVGLRGCAISEISKMSLSEFMVFTEGYISSLELM